MSAKENKTRKAASDLLLAEAADIIGALLKAVPAGHCSDFHHGKKDRHELCEPCPIVKRWQATVKRAEDFIRQQKGKGES